MAYENEASVARRFYEEVLNKGDFAVANEILDTDFFDHGSPIESPKGTEGFKQFFAMVSSIFPDIQVAIEDIVAGDGKVAVRLTVRGTQKGSFRGFPATGKYVSWTGIDILHFSGSKISQRWGERDFLGMLLQLGLISPPG